MTPGLLRRIFSWLGLSTFATASLAFLRTSGLEVDIPVPGLSKQGPYGVTVLAIPVVCALALVLHWLVRAYARTKLSSPPVDRIPLAFAEPEQVDTQSSGGRLYAWGGFALFALAPVLTLFALYAKLIASTTQLRGGPQFAQGLEHFWSPVPINWGRYNDYIVTDGPTYFPLLTPYGYMLLIALTLYSAWTTWRAVHARAICERELPT